MASTNKTPHLGLCQWVEADPFLREDMNGDFAKIDAAIGSRLKLELLRDISLPPQTVKQIDLDVSDIDFGRYMFIILNAPSIRNSLLRINGSTDGSYHIYDSRSSESNGIIEFDSNSRVFLYPLGNPDSPVSATMLRTFRFICGYSKNTTYAQIKTLTLAVRYTDETYNAPTQVKLWGVRI